MAATSSRPRQIVMLALFGGHYVLMMQFYTVLLRGGGWTRPISHTLSFCLELSLILAGAYAGTHGGGAASYA